MKYALLIALIVGACSFSQPWSAQTKAIHLSAVGLRHLVVDTRNGKITLKAGADNALAITAVKHAPSGQIAQLHTQVSQRGDTLRVIADYPWGCYWQCGGIDYTLIVPARMQPKLTTTNGNIEVVGLRGDLRGETTNGDFVARRIGASAWLTTTNGNVRASVAASTGTPTYSLQSTNGNISLHLPHAIGLYQINASTTNGSLDTGLGIGGRHSVKHTYAQRGASVRLETTNGSVTFTHHAH